MPLLGEEHHPENGTAEATIDVRWPAHYPELCLCSFSFGGQLISTAREKHWPGLYCYIKRSEAESDTT
jgi:hypothetical protein